MRGDGGGSPGVGVVIHHVFKQWKGRWRLFGVNDRLSLWAVPAALGEDKTGGVGASGAPGSHRSLQRKAGSLGQCVWAERAEWGGGGGGWGGSRAREGLRTGS